MGGATSYRHGFLRRAAGDRRPHTLVDDVIEHLGHLLNTKQDYGSFQAGFGLDISDAMWGKEPLTALAEHLGQAIVRYEPRLQDARLTLLDRDDELCPRFRLEGNIGGAPIRLALSLHTLHCTVTVRRSG